VTFHNITLIDDIGKLITTAQSKELH